ncbi:phenylalanine--tRNA ligase subunit beta-related protein, partial [Hydrogenimonas sp.]
KRNVAMSKRRVPLFEVGRVFDSERRERFHLLLVHTGEKEPPSIGNQGKPGPIDFWSFTTRLSAVVGPFELEAAEPQNGLMHPYQTAAILIDGKRVGTLSKLHPSVAESFDLPDTYFAEFDLPALAARHVRSEAISAYTPIQRDLSLLIPKTVRYQDVRAALAGALPETVERFFAVDLYDDESLGEKMSLTLRFVIASKEKTLEEREINDVMAAILQRLEKELGATLR